jgi:uncharacterized RmlC-like cupin family protein
MTQGDDFRDSVRVIRATSLAEAMKGPAGSGRATAFEFSGPDGRTWIGAVSMAPGERNGGHRHGRHEVGLYVVRGRGEIRWGERLEFAARVGPGDFIYFAPFAPHQEVNLDPEASLDFVVARSDSERIFELFETSAAKTPHYLA